MVLWGLFGFFMAPRTVTLAIHLCSLLVLVTRDMPITHSR